MKVPSELKVWLKVRRKWLYFGIAERRGERVGGDLQDGDPARQHEQAEQDQRNRRRGWPRRASAGSRRSSSPSAMRIDRASTRVRASSTAAGKDITP